MNSTEIQTRNDEARRQAQFHTEVAEVAAPVMQPAGRTASFGLRVSVFLAAIAAGLLLLSLRLPLWHMRLEAPQYRGPEALRVMVRPGAMTGNLGEIKILNQYIGVTIPDTLPQTRWLPPALGFCAGLGLLGVLLPLAFRRPALWTVASLLALALVTAAAQAQWQMYRIGHQRNHHAALQGVGDFTPPLLGTRKLAQFELTSGLGLGSGCVAGAWAIYVLLGWAAQNANSGRSDAGPRAGSVSPAVNQLQETV